MHHCLLNCLHESQDTMYDLYSHSSSSPFPTQHVVAVLSNGNHVYQPRRGYRKSLKVCASRVRLSQVLEGATGSPTVQQTDIVPADRWSCRTLTPLGTLSTTAWISPSRGDLSQAVTASSTCRKCDGDGMANLEQRIGFLHGMLPSQAHQRNLLTPVGTRGHLTHTSRYQAKETDTKRGGPLVRQRAGSNHS